MRLTVKAKPGTSRPSVRRAADGIVVAVRERAVDGQANEAILAAIAAWLNIAPSRVRLTRGAGSRMKVVEIDADQATVHAALAALPD